ncbi:MAG: response regulator transcription factor [Limnobacter sp.]|uniref:response regulator n=1 Tax=Limnobacter sp. TaxID=2003368 RepID=UPI0022BCC1F9|nr:response regulator transcription factor [Limnobacter sp.]MCZ8014631.1 response regulator transcription factor [Limnobacter sp.]
MSYLIVDDHPLIRQSYSQIISQINNGDARIDHADNATSAWLKWSELRHKVVVLDINLPDISGLDLATKILRRQPDTRVMFFSMHDELGLVNRAMKLGACAYVSKSAEPEEFSRAIRAISDGKNYIEQRLATSLVCAKGLASNTLAELSVRENEIFLMIAKGYSSRQIGELLNLSAKTVANNLSIIKQKLNVDTTAAMAHLAVSLQLIEIYQPTGQPVQPSKLAS